MSFTERNPRPGAPRRILQLGEPALRSRALEVEAEAVAGADVQALIDDLIATMRAAGGAGLAATQVGEKVRVCVIEVDHNPRYPYKPPIPLTVLVNPVLTSLTDERFVNNEGCLSVPGLRGEVARSTEVRVQALNRHGEVLDFCVCGLSAGTFQHECDHLDGVLFTDRLIDAASLSTWENFERYHRAAYLERVEAFISRYGQ